MVLDINMHRKYILCDESHSMVLLLSQEQIRKPLSHDESPSRHGMVTVPNRWYPPPNNIYIYIFLNMSAPRHPSPFLSPRSNENTAVVQRGETHRESLPPKVASGKARIPLSYVHIKMPYMRFPEGHNFSQVIISRYSNHVFCLLEE